MYGWHWYRARLHVRARNFVSDYGPYMVLGLMAGVLVVIAFALSAQAPGCGYDDEGRKLGCLTLKAIP